MKHFTAYIGILLVSSIFLAGCQTQSTELSAIPDFPVETSANAATVPVSHSAPPTTLISASTETVKGTGTIADESVDGEKLNTGQKKILKDYMNLYYQSLAGLKAENPANLFAANAQQEAAVRQSAWQVIIAVRELQKVDLSLTGYAWHLDVLETTVEENSDVSIMVKRKCGAEF